MFAARLSPLIGLFVLLAAVGAACGGGDIGEAPPAASQVASPVASESATAQQHEAQQASGARDQPDRAGEAGEAGGADQAGGAGGTGGAEQAGGDAASASSAPAAFDGQYALSIVRHLSDELGPRVAGTGSDLDAARYLAKTLADLGYEASLEPFSYNNDPEMAMISTGDERIASGLLLEGSEQGIVRGRIAVVPGAGTAEDFGSVDLRDAIAVVGRGGRTHADSARHAAEAGAAALVIYNHDDSMFAGTLQGESEIPVLAVGRWVGLTLRKLASDAGGSQEDAAIIEIQAGRSGPAFKSWNVVARKPNGVCRVVVGGHYDTVPGVDGANDNASGTGIVVALARAWADAISARDVCFVAFGAEEVGLHGSWHFVFSMRDSGEIERLRAMLNLDAVGGYGLMISRVADAELQLLAVHLGDELGIETRPWATPLVRASDHFSFADAGIPVLWFVVGGPIHLPSDNWANVSQGQIVEVGKLAHAALACLLERAGSQIEPPVRCDGGEE